MKGNMWRILPKLGNGSRAQILHTKTVIVAAAMLCHFVCPFRVILFQSRTFNRRDLWQFHFGRTTLFLYIIQFRSGKRKSSTVVVVFGYRSSDALPDRIYQALVKDRRIESSDGYIAIGHVNRWVIRSCVLPL